MMTATHAVLCLNGERELEDIPVEPWEIRRLFSRTVHVSFASAEQPFSVF